MITKEKALDILDKMDFFQGQRAGRELWNEKSRYVQEMDLQIFREDVSELKAYIADVVPRDEVAKIFEEIERNIFKFETPYQTLHCIPSGFIEELKEKYTKGGEGHE
jgi:hypothetical protein